MKKMIIFTIVIVGIMFGWQYFSKTLEINELNLAPLASIQPYTPPASQEAVANLRKVLPYKNSNFDIVWNSITDQADAVLFSPHAENSVLLLNWLADNNASNLPLGTLNIIKK